MKKYIEWLNTSIDNYFAKDEKYWKSVRLYYKNMSDYEAINASKVTEVIFIEDGVAKHFKSKDAAQTITKLGHGPIKDYFILDGKVYNREPQSILFEKPKPTKNEKRLHDIVKKFIYFFIESNKKMKAIERNKEIVKLLNQAISRHSELLYTTDMVRKIIKKENLTPST